VSTAGAALYSAGVEPGEGSTVFGSARSIRKAARPCQCTRKSIFGTVRPWLRTKNSNFLTVRPWLTAKNSNFLTVRPCSETKKSISGTVRPWLMSKNSMGGGFGLISSIVFIVVRVRDLTDTRKVGRALARALGVVHVQLHRD
jgi:hypothetical protein